ncbi:MAG TPA: DUF1877 family protein, partial [Chloroflexia bacterium]|nr:DUF1877 family protein [Chloroflexia bacterium]
LTDGQLAMDNGSYPLKLCILGGRQLYIGEDYIVSLITPDQVRDVAQALTKIDRAMLRTHYFQIDPHDYGADLDEADFAYTWDWFEGLPAFYARAAAAQRAVIFTVDQ